MNLYQTTLFTEIGENLRLTELKQLTITIAHNATIGAVAILITTKEIYESDPVMSVVTFSSSIFSALILAAQRRYQFWKSHYRIIMRYIVDGWSIDESKKPRWLLIEKDPRPTLRKTDQITQFFTFFSWFVMTVSCIVFVLSSLKFTGLSFVIASVTTLFQVACMRFAFIKPWDD